MDVVLIRHARPDVGEGTCYGCLDLALAQPISPASAQILRACGPQRPARMIASPLLRAAHTAEMLAQALGEAAPAIETDARLRELDFGQWEGMAWDAIPRASLDAWAADLLDGRPHGGESAAQAMARVCEWAESLPVETPEVCWVVAHAGPMRMLAAHWLGVPLAVTLGWQLEWGATCGFRLGAGRNRLGWWNRQA
jgi:alpha-ribazole phosphatase